MEESLFRMKEYLSKMSGGVAMTENAEWKKMPPRSLLLERLKEEGSG